VLSVVSDRQRDEFSPLSVWPSDVRASLPSNNVEGKNGLPRRRHHPCQPLPVSHRSPVSYFSRRRSWRGRPFCSLAQGHRPYSYSTHDKLQRSVPSQVEATNLVTLPLATPIQLPPYVASTTRMAFVGFVSSAVAPPTEEQTIIKATPSAQPCCIRPTAILVNGRAGGLPRSF